MSEAKRILVNGWALVMKGKGGDRVVDISLCKSSLWDRWVEALQSVDCKIRSRRSVIAFWRKNGWRIVKIDTIVNIGDEER